MARLDREVQEIRNHALHVEEGLLSRQLRDGSVLRATQGRVLLWPRLVGMVDPWFHGCSR